MVNVQQDPLLCLLICIENSGLGRTKNILHYNILNLVPSLPVLTAAQHFPGQETPSSNLYNTKVIRRPAIAAKVEDSEHRAPSLSLDFENLHPPHCHGLNELAHPTQAWDM